MKERIELQRARDFGDILNDTFVFIGQNFLPLLKSYLAICGVFIIGSMALGFIASAQRSTMTETDFIFSPYYWSQIGVSGLEYTSLLLTTMAYLAVYKEKGNQPGTLAEVWGYFRYYFFRLLGITIMTWILTIIGSVLCLLPGIYLGIVFSLTAPVMVMENGSIDYTFRRVFQIIKGNWWYAFGVVLLMGIIFLIGFFLLLLPIIFIIGPAAWLSGKELDGTRGILEAIFSSFGSLFYVFPTIAITLLYFDITEQKEANNLSNRIKMFGQHPDGPNAGNPSAEQY